MISRLINMHLTNKRYTITFTSFSAFNTRLPYKINFHIILACHLPPNHPHLWSASATFKLGGFLRCCGCFARHLVNPQTTEVKAPVGPNHLHGDHPCLDCKLQGHLHLPQTETFGKKNPQVKKRESNRTDWHHDSWPVFQLILAWDFCWPVDDESGIIKWAWDTPHDWHVDLFPLYSRLSDFYAMYCFYYCTWLASTPLKKYYCNEIRSFPQEPQKMPTSSIWRCIVPTHCAY